MRDSLGRFTKGSHSLTEFKKGGPVNEKHPGWKGDKVSYAGIHKWVSNHWGQPKRCDNCGTNEAKRYEWANISGKYTRDPNDWKRLCKKCHNRMDNVTARGWVTRRRVAQFV